MRHLFTVQQLQQLCRMLADEDDRHWTATLNSQEGRIYFRNEVGMEICETIRLFECRLPRERLPHLVRSLREINKKVERLCRPPLTAV